MKLFSNKWWHSVKHDIYGLGLLCLIWESKVVLLLLHSLRNEQLQYFAIFSLAPGGLWTDLATYKSLGYIVCKADCNNFSCLCVHTPLQSVLDAPPIEKSSLPWPLSPGWPWDLLWPVECGESNMKILNIGLEASVVTLVECCPATWQNMA